MQLALGKKHLGMKEFTENEWLPNFELKLKFLENLKKNTQTQKYEKIHWLWLWKGSNVCALARLTKIENIWFCSGGFSYAIQEKVTAWRVNFTRKTDIARIANIGFSYIQCSGKNKINCWRKQRDQQSIRTTNVIVPYLICGVKAAVLHYVTCLWNSVSGFVASFLSFCSACCRIPTQQALRWTGTNFTSQSSHSVPRCYLGHWVWWHTQQSPTTTRNARFIRRDSKPSRKFHRHQDINHPLDGHFPNRKQRINSELSRGRYGASNLPRWRSGWKRSFESTLRTQRSCPASRSHKGGS